MADERNPFIESDPIQYSASQYFNGRPIVSVADKTVSVDASGGGDYESIQAAVENELPFFIEHEINFDISAGTYDEHVIVPPYVANWVENSADGERVPVQFTGDTVTPSNVSVDTFTFSAGVGVAQVLGMEFTNDTTTGGVDNEDAHVSVYNTNRVDIQDCVSAGGATRFINCYNAQTKVGGVDAGTNNLTEFVKVKNFGVYYENAGKNGISGSVTGNVYDHDLGEIRFLGNTSTCTGASLVDGAGAGFVTDEENKEIHQQWTMADVFKAGGLQLDPSLSNVIYRPTDAGSDQMFRSPGGTNLLKLQAEGWVEFLNAGNGFAVTNTENLSGKAGNTDGEVRRDDGTNATAGEYCRWDNANNQWVPLEGSARFS